MRCRHSHSWLVSWGRYEWCAQCGALRPVSELESDDKRIIAELKAVLEAATGTTDVTISVPMVAGSVARFVRDMRQQLASREAALREIRNITAGEGGCGPTRTRQIYDRAAQEVGR